MKKASGYYSADPDTIHVLDGFNPREVFETDDLEADIAQNGVRVSLLVRKAPKAAEHGKALELIDGERRLRCALAANLETVPVKVETFTDQAEGLFVALSTGSGGRPLDALEESRAIVNLIELGWAPSQVAERWGRTEAWVSQRRSLENLSAKARNALREGKITYSLARNLATVDGATAQNEKLKAAIAKAKRKAPAGPSDSTPSNGDPTAEIPPKAPAGISSRPGLKDIRKIAEAISMVSSDAKFSPDDLVSVLKWVCGEMDEADMQDAIGI